MNEKNTTQGLVGTSFKAIFRDRGLWYNKWRDDGGWQPFDASMVVDGVPFAMEYKASKLKKGITFKSLFSEGRTKQLDELEKFERAKGYGLVIIQYCVPRKSRFFIMRHYEAREYYNIGQQIPWSELEKHEVFTKRDPLKGTIIDFAPYMEQFGILKD